MPVFAFDEATHVYTLDGRRLPSVSQIIKPLTFDEYRWIPDDVLAAAADRGRRVHLATQLLDERDLDETSVEADVAGYLDAYMRFLAETGAEVIELERQLHHPVLLYAGTLDRVYRIWGKRSLVDIKSTDKLLPAVWPQLMGYDDLRKANGLGGVDEHACLHLKPDGTYKYVPMKPEHAHHHRGAFHGLRAAHIWKEKFCV